MSTFTPVRKLQVFRRLGDGGKVAVGTLAQNARAVYFQYDADYLRRYHTLSPFRLPFDGEVHQAPATPHQGLHGVFADSLPDGWGLLLMDRVFRRHGVLPQQLTAMDRLAYVGDRGIGALGYEPVSRHAPITDGDRIDVALLGEQARRLFEGDTETIPTELAAAGSSGGARPKAQIYLAPSESRQASTEPRPGLEPWLVKFTSSRLPLGHEESLCEATYLSMAARAGIEVPQWRLLTPPAGPAIAWLALRRFDHTDEGRCHVHSASGLLDADFRQPSLDYEDLIKAGQVLCRSPAVGRELFTRAVFNLFALNQDDHGRNWAFIMDDDGTWGPAPFYDVTFSPTPYYEHTTAFGGYGKAPPLKVMQRLAEQASFGSWKQAREVIAEVVEAIQDWNEIAGSLEISPDTRRLIGEQLEAVRQQNKTLLAG